MSLPLIQPVTTADFSAALIALVEGMKLRAYRDSGGVWTNGLGHTGPDVTPLQVITPQKAAQWFAEDQAPLLELVAGMPILKGAAYSSFGFNCGIEKLRKVLAGLDSIGAPVHTTDRHGVVLGGLIARRHFEMLLIQLSDQLGG